MVRTVIIVSHQHASIHSRHLYFLFTRYISKTWFGNYTFPPSAHKRPWHFTRSELVKRIDEQAEFSRRHWLPKYEIAFCWEFLTSLRSYSEPICHIGRQIQGTNRKDKFHKGEHIGVPE